MPAISDFLKKSGLNHIIKDKKLYFNWTAPFSFVATGNNEVKKLKAVSRLNFGKKQKLADTGCSLVEMAGNYQLEAPADLENAYRSIWLQVLDKVLTYDECLA